MTSQPGVGVGAYGRWGAPDHSADLSKPARALLDEFVGRPQPQPAVPLADIHVLPSQLSDMDQDGLRSAVGAAGFDLSQEGRLAAAGGSSFLELLRLRADRQPDVPDAVVAPQSHDEVAAVLAYCSLRDIAVVPFGGGTSVVGGVTPVRGRFAALIALSLHRMSGLVSFDSTSHLATFLPGTTGPQAEQALAPHRLTLGHLPQSWERATVGGWLATRSAGQNSSGYGRSDEMVESLTVATPVGSLNLGRVPASAAGPDLKQLFVGSEGILGVITEATLRVRELPEVGRYEGYVFPNWETGVNVFREFAQHGIKPDIMRLSDPDESHANLVMGTSARTYAVLERYLNVRRIRGGALAILGWEGTSDIVAARRSLATSRLRKVGAVKLGERVGEGWKKGRFHAPFLRDTLLDQGYLVETLETATSWENITALRHRLADVLRLALADDGPGPLVMSHISHVYETGASLYITVIGRGDQADVRERWTHAKAMASDAIVASGATITHHHAVGRDHAPWYEAEVGSLGVEVVRALKQRLDPNGVMNPGVMIG